MAHGSCRPTGRQGWLPVHLAGPGACSCCRPADGQGKPPALIGYRENSKMVLPSTSVITVGWAAQNGCCQCLQHQGESCLSMRVSKISKWSDPGSFQAIASALVLGAREILHLHFKGWSLYFLYPSGFPEFKPCLFSKPDILGAHLPSAGPQAGEPNMRLRTPCSSGRTSAVVISLSFLGCWPRGVVLHYNCISTPPTHPVVVHSLSL